MTLIKTDIAILYAWAGGQETVQKGYAHVAYNDGQPISEQRAKKRVYAALDRFGFKHYPSYNLIQAWLYWKRYFEKHGSEIT